MPTGMLPVNPCVTETCGYVSVRFLCNEANVDLKINFPISEAHLDLCHPLKSTNERVALAHTTLPWQSREAFQYFQHDSFCSRTMFAGYYVVDTSNVGIVMFVLVR